MPAPDPAVVERQMYLTLLGWTVDDPTYSLAELRDLTGGGADGRKAVEAATTSNRNNNQYIDLGNVSGNINISAFAQTVLVLNMTGHTSITLDGALNGTSVNIFATGAFNLTVNGQAVPTGECVCIRIKNAWQVRLIGSPLVQVNTVAPTFDDIANTYTIPNATGIIYKVSSVVKAAGTYSVGNVTTTVVVDAEAAPGYKIATGDTISWLYNFTFALTWSTVATDDFTGADASAVDGRALSGGTYTWLRTDAQASTAAILTNRWRHTAAANYSHNIKLNPAPVNPAPAGYRVSFNYDGASTNKFLAEIRWNSPSYGAIAGYYGIQNGTVLREATALDQTPSTITAVSGQSLTGHPLAGKFTVEIAGTSVKIYINDVLIATGVTPGAIIQQTYQIGVSGASAGGTCFVDNALFEHGA